MAGEPKVVVIGGGFGGLHTARTLAGFPVQVTLIDRRNHHLFQPLLYQVATAGLSAAEIAMPIRKIFRKHPRVEVLLGEVTGFDLERKKVLLRDGELVFDYLVVATGATHAYFGHEEWARFAPGLKSIEDAFEIRRRIFFAFEAAERSLTPVSEGWLTFVVVGAGPTGVELAGAIAEIARQTLVGDFRHIDPRNSRIMLIEGQDRVLPTFPPELSEKARLQLAALGVEVLLNTKVVEVTSDGVETESSVQPNPTSGDGEPSAPSFLKARTVLWAAGVRASPLGASLGAPLERGGQVKVTPELTVPGRNDIFVIGDLASLEIDGERVPALAPAAMQQGQHVAENIDRAMRGEPYRPFRYVDRGIMATIGRSAAVARVGRFRLSGFIAWMAWVLIHLLTLIGFRNRFVALFTWVWAYFTYQRAGRLILETPALTEQRLLDAGRIAIPSGLTSEPVRAAPPEP